MVCSGVTTHTFFLIFIRETLRSGGEREKKEISGRILLRTPKGLWWTFWEDSDENPGRIQMIILIRIPWGLRWEIWEDSNENLHRMRILIWWESRDGSDENFYRILKRGEETSTRILREVLMGIQRNFRGFSWESSEDSDKNENFNHKTLIFRTQKGETLLLNQSSNYLNTPIKLLIILSLRKSGI